MGGAPVFAGTRVPVQTLFEYLEAGDTIDDFYFPTVTRQQVVALLETAKGKVLAEVKGRSCWMNVWMSAWLMTLPGTTCLPSGRWAGRASRMANLWLWRKSTLKLSSPRIAICRG